jgi:hypothetical protein
MTARHRVRPRHMMPLSGHLHARGRPRGDGACRNVQHAQGRRSRSAGAGARPRAPMDVARADGALIAVAVIGVLS